MLAQIDSVPIQLAAWLGCLAFFVGLLNGMLKLVDRMKGRGTLVSPQPLEVREAHDFVREPDCRMRHSEMERQVRELRAERNEDVKSASISRKSMYEEMKLIRKEIDEMERRLNQADETRTEKVHERINDILEAVGEIRGHQK